MAPTDAEHDLAIVLSHPRAVLVLLFLARTQDAGQHFRLFAFRKFMPLQVGHAFIVAAAQQRWEIFNKHQFGAQHSPIHDYTVEFVDREHPITRGLQKSFLESQDELYFNMQMQPAGTYHVLATAWDDNALYVGKSRVPLVGAGKNEPMMWTVSALLSPGVAREL